MPKFSVCDKKNPNNDKLESSVVLMPSTSIASYPSSCKYPQTKTEVYVVHSAVGC